MTPRSPRSAPPLRTRRPRILLVRLSAIGDVLHALPVAAAIRRARPEARIDWLVEDRAADVVQGLPALDGVRVLPRRRWRDGGGGPWRWPRTAFEAARFVAGLVTRRYDAVVDLQGNLKSGLLGWLALAPTRYGFSSGVAREGNAFFTNRHVPTRSRHRVERNLELAGALLGEHVPYAASEPARRPEDVAWSDAALAAAGLPRDGYAVLHPGTSGFGAFKRWPAERFGALADRLAREAGLAVLLAHGPGEEGLAAAVRAHARLPLPAIAAPSLSVLAEVLRRARVFVSADTGPLHLAAAVGTPVLGLFGPKDERVYGPYGVPRGGDAAGPLPVSVRSDVPCRPCTLRWCPEPVCMTSIEVDDVLARVRALIAPA